MENRLKERLTGAAILVALIVLVVPELFQGRRDALSGGARGAPDAPVVRSYVIDLKESGAHDAAPPAAQPAPAPGAAPVAPGGTTPPVSTAVPAGADTHPLSSGAAPSVAAPAPGPAANVAATAAPAPAVPPSHAAAGDAPGWSVQLGLFAQRENAQRLLQAAQSRGFAVSIAGADANGPYRVRVAGLADRASAENVRARLRAQGFAAAIVGP